MVNKRWVTSVGALAAAGVLAAGCASPHVVRGGGDVPAHARCLPSPLRLSPVRVAAGAVAELSAGPFSCPASYPPEKRYQVLLSSEGRNAPVALGSYPVARDGSFVAELHVPRAVAAGLASVIVRGSAFDRPCQDTSGSCAGYGTALTVLPPG